MMKNVIYLFTLSLLMTTVVTASAVAAEKPTGNWIVGPIKASGSAQHCSMKAQYQNDTLLVVGKGVSGKGSVAIDFKKDVLAKGQKYPVDLSVVSGVSRSGQGVAATPSVLVVQLGQDDTFLEFLGRKEVLNVGVNGKTHSFALNGTAKAVRALDNCITSLSKGRDVKQVALPVPAKMARAVPVVEKSKPRQSVQENYVHVERTAQQDVQPESLVRDIEPASGDSVEQSRFDASLAQELAVLKAENEKLRVKIQQSQKIAEPVIPPQVLQETSALKQQNQTLQQQLNRLQTEKSMLQGDYSSLKQKLAQNSYEQQRIAGMLQSGNLISNLLGQANIAKEADLQMQTSPDGSKKAWLWSTPDNLIGIGQELPWETGTAFLEMVDGYFADAESRCDGDYAARKDKVEVVAGAQILRGEMACLGGQSESAAAVLFVGINGKLSVISHEGTPSQAQASLLKRDAVSAVLLK